MSHLLVAPETEAQVRMALWLLNEDDHDVGAQLLFVHSHFHFEQHCFFYLVLPKFDLSPQKGQ